MKNYREQAKFIIIAVCCFFVSAVLITIFPSNFSGINDFSSRYVYSLSRKSVKVPKLIGIEVDNYSVRKLSQRYPLKRSSYAELIKILNSEKVNTIGFDLVFSGVSEDPADDLLFKETLKNISSRVVLGAFIDNLPLAEFIDSSYGVGILNSPGDKDERIRRLLGSLDIDGKTYYSLSVMLASSFLKESPQEVLTRFHTRQDRTFFINYLIKPNDIIRLSLYDAINNLDKLKQEYGSDFLKGALVLVYPHGEVSHDIQATPLGVMPGGLLHINGTADIILGKTLNNAEAWLFPLIIFSLVALFYILKYAGFLYGVIFTSAITFIIFWCVVALGLKGMRVDFSLLVISNLLLFVSMSLYKYVSFLAQLLKIKIKATIDPLRGVFTLRYFYYRLELELKKLYFSKAQFLIFIHLESFRPSTDNLSIDEAKNLWRRIRDVISLKDSFWSLYSQEEIVGCIAVNPSQVDALVNSLKNNLGYCLQDLKIKTKISLGYLKLKKGYPIRELLFVVQNELKKNPDTCVFFKEQDLIYLLHTTYPRIREADQFLEGLGEDIEEKNRQLLVLIDSLNKEHAKTKEAFMQTITSLAKALEARDPYTEGHSQRVASYALKMADKLDWSSELKEKLNNAALLHDLGKIGIPDSILHKKDRLNDEEYDFIKKHELISIKILEPLKDIKDILPWIMYHHEKWDGTGYPHGLGGNNIPLGAQIIALADTFDAITTGRDYKKALSTEEAINELNRAKGTQFNPQLIDAFIEAIKKA